MADPAPSSDPKPTLSFSDRLQLIQTLNGLPTPTFEELVFALNPPPGIVPDSNAALGHRVSEFLKWAEGPMGPGLLEVLNLVRPMVGEPALPAVDSTRAQPSKLFIVPFDRNKYFTGRDNILDSLHTVLQREKVTALSGLGGIGKTQTAVEYAYRHQDDYQAVLWIRSETQEEFASELSALAQDLGLTQTQESEQAAVIQAVKRWLSTHQDWLLVLDNADNLNLVRDWLSLKKYGHLLLTTRVSETRPLAERIEIQKLSPEEGAVFLLRRAAFMPAQGQLSEASEENQQQSLRLSQVMDGLPLALDQAGAFILETRSSLEEYHQLYESAAPALLAKRGELAIDHPSVTVTFSLAFERLIQRSAVAADLLRLCAYLAPDGIPEEIFTKGASVFDAELQAVAQNPLQLIDVLTEAGRFSLISRSGQDKTLTMHRLVQAVLKERL
ncbi:MAG: NB-ARC domain-containing protein, partial [Cyanobacteria bacterium J06627_8]